MHGIVAVLKDETNYADESGPSWSPLRQFIPSWLLCTEKDRDENTRVERHLVRVEGKVENADSEQRAALVNEMGQGFGKLNKLKDEEALKPLPMSAVSIMGGSIATGATILTDIS